MHSQNHKTKRLQNTGYSLMAISCLAVGGGLLAISQPDPARYMRANAGLTLTMALTTSLIGLTGIVLSAPEMITHIKDNDRPAGQRPPPAP